MKDSRVVFVRMHARYQAPDTHELLSTITYDRTFVIDLRPRKPEAIAAAMPKDGRRGVKRAARVAAEADCVMAEETGLSRQAFDEVYAVMVTTAERAPAPECAACPSRPGRDGDGNHHARPW